MSEKLKFAIVGCGMIASYHAKALNEIDGAVLSGAFDADKDALQKFCLNFNIKAFESFDDVLKSDEVDAICICLPSGLHYEFAIKCAKHKKHIVIEKPIALNIEQCDEIISCAEENHIMVTVISQLRYTESVKHLKNAVEKNLFGKITLADISMKFYRDPEYYSSSKWKGTVKMDGGGALMNQGIHGIDLLQYIMGPVKSVQAISKTLFHNIETEDTLVAILEYENGAVGTVQATTSVYPGYQRKISVCGTEGTVVLCEDKIESWDMKNKDFMPVISNDGLNMKTGSRPDGMDFSLHKMQLNDFVECIKNNKKPFIDAYEGKKSVEIICAIYKSAKNGTKIYL